MSTPSSKSPSDLQRLGGIFTKALLGIAIVLFGLEFFIHRHGVVSAEKSFMFPAVYGFLAKNPYTAGNIKLFSADTTPCR